MLRDEEILNDDGTYQPAVHDTIVTAIVKQVKAPTRKSKKPYLPLKPEADAGKSNKESEKESTSSSEEESVNLKEEIYPIDEAMPGVLIGYAGRTIRKLEQETGARITIIDDNNGKACLIRAENDASIQLAKTKIEATLKSAKKRPKISSKSSTDPKKSKK